MSKQIKGTHEYRDGSGNADIVIDINGEFCVSHSI